MSEQELARQKRIQQHEIGCLNNSIVHLENQITHIKQQIVSPNHHIQLAEQIPQNTMSSQNTVLQ